jgi:hypothetical protein
MGIESGIINYHDNEDSIQAKKCFSELVQPSQYVGELYSINYETSRVLVHDHERQSVGGIPSLCFLLATRVNPNAEHIDFKDEDNSVIILRVLDAASLPNSTEAERIRVETAQRISGEIDVNWDSDGIMDSKTRVYLGYAAISCRIIGTFFLDKNEPAGKLDLKFGCDISNYYPNRGLKVYKPSGKALQAIVNYTDPINLRDHEDKYGKTKSVKIGNIRYASTNRKYQDVDDVPVHIHPIDLLSQKTALFGMTRTGKSNTTKIIAKSVYDLRKSHSEIFSGRIGQLIFDPNGEYANENVQDKDEKGKSSALKNIWKSIPNVSVYEEVVTYGISPVDNDPDRKMMLVNFHSDDFLQIGKEILNTIIQSETAQYMRNFYDVSFNDRPNKADYTDESLFYSEMTRYGRRVLVYRALLNKAGYKPPSNLNALLKKGRFVLFSKDIITAMKDTTHKDKKKESAVHTTASVLEKEQVSWDALSDSLEGLFVFLGTEAYAKFNQGYIENSKSGDSWADVSLSSILEMFAYPKGTITLGRCAEQHSPSAKSDFAEDIYKDLCAGKLVIVDQSVGEPEFNETVAKRVMWKIFRENQAVFRSGKPLKDILVYVEEAHNLLPAGNNLDLKDVWVRTAKEGAKYRIGLVYATQEVSSIHKNILKNTANWFISHLNNTDETRELCKFYDFSDFEPSIRRAQDKGFLRVKTMSNFFVIPVQVDKFMISN